MEPEKRTPAGKRGLGWLCLGYAVVMVYSSTVIGPAGLHFVFQDPSDAFRRFLATRFVVHGSDQRADWIGNLLMLVPFGFIVTATIWPRRKIFRLPAAVAALLICMVIILGIKYRNCSPHLGHRLCG
jgi:peptidoglycan/LPS O-acetylase OafA/YrhL